MTSPIEELAPVEPLVSLRYLTSELRRRRHVWVLSAIVGLIIGVGYHHIVPPNYEASTVLILAHPQNVDPTNAMATDVALASTRPVGENAATALGLPRNKLIKQYAVVQLTPSLLKITANGPSYAQAVIRANAIANSYLAFRATQLQNQNKEVVDALNQDINSLQATMGQLKKVIDSPSTSKSAGLAALTQQSQDGATLTQLQATAQADIVSTTSIVGGSTVIDKAAPILRSKTKLSVLNGLTGLIGGLGIGLLIVVIPCLMSNRLRSRYDIARALEAPVDLSVPRSRRLGRRRWRAAEKVANYLYLQIVASSAPALHLAVVAIDNVKDCAVALDVLAYRLADDDRRVLLADLTPTGVLARHHHVGAEGIARGRRREKTHTGEIAVGRPSDAIAATGPFVAADGQSDRDPRWNAAAVHADIVITLAELEPGSGAGYLTGWARQAVAVVTAGSSSGVKIQSVGNMIRHAGLQLQSAILLNADPKDETTGIIDPDQPEVPHGRFAGAASL